MTSAVQLDCPACGAIWQYSLGQELVCPGCGVDVLLGGDMFCGAGGSTKGALTAIGELKLPVLFTCVNHWDREFAGNVGEVTKQIGNAVPVRTAAALVRAILGGQP